jgi:hypothetical protein
MKAIAVLSGLGIAALLAFTAMPCAPTAEWPISRFGEVWNNFAGVARRRAAEFAS